MCPACTGVYGSKKVVTQGSLVKKIVGKSTGVYGSKINTVRDLPGGYMLTGRRDSERPTPSGVPAKKREVFLVTGACGQVGSELVSHLRQMYGAQNVIATDVRSAT